MSAAEDARQAILEALGDADVGSLMCPETLTWQHAQRGVITCRCGVTPVNALPFADAQRFLAVPEFSGGQARLIVHPDGPRPPVGSTCDHPRFGLIRVLAWGPEGYFTGLREGAVSWSA